MKLLLIADIEDNCWTFGSGEADVLVSCGDVPDAVILEAANAYGCKRVYAVKGNHDMPSPFPSPIVDLHLRVDAYAGIRFGGFNGAWRYKPRGAFLYDEAEVSRLMSGFPPVDIFVAHNAPRGLHDRLDGIHNGFTAFGDTIERVRPSLFIHGHQHTDTESTVGGTRVIGVHGFRLLELG